MKELLVTLLSYVPSSNPYYKHLINNSTDEERSNKCVFILFDFCSTSTDATDDSFFQLVFFYSFKQDALSSSSFIPFTVFALNFHFQDKVFYLRQFILNFCSGQSEYKTGGKNECDLKTFSSVLFLANECHLAYIYIK